MLIFKDRLPRHLGSSSRDPSWLSAQYIAICSLLSREIVIISERIRKNMDAVLRLAGAADFVPLVEAVTRWELGLRFITIRRELLKSCIMLKLQ
jgi:hypothetical protein